MPSTDTKQVVLVSGDGQRFEVPLVSVATCESKTISELLEALSGQDDGGDGAGAAAATDRAPEVPLPNLTGACLAKVADYMRRHAGLRDRADLFALAQWDAKFIAVDPPAVLDLITAANYLDMKPLLDLACGRLVAGLEGMTTEAVRGLLGIENDLTEEEEALIRQENAWLLA